MGTDTLQGMAPNTMRKFTSIVKSVFAKLGSEAQRKEAASPGSERNHQLRHNLKPGTPDTKAGALNTCSELPQLLWSTD